jgi:hypothetical protein
MLQEFAVKVGTLTYCVHVLCVTSVLRAIAQALGIEVLCREPGSWLSAKPGAHDTGSDFSSEQ